MPILWSDLIAAECPSVADVMQIPAVDYAKLLTAARSKLFDEIANTAVVLAALACYEPRYIPPPFTPPPVQEKHVHIVINLIVDTPSQG